MKKLIIIFATFFIMSNANALAFSAKCLWVTDGDTLTVWYNNQKTKIRLYGIDAPERDQPFGSEAKAFLQPLENKMIEFEVLDQDRYKRLVSIITYQGRNINQALIENGLAWVYLRYCQESFCQAWVKFEDAAKKAGIRLWSDKNPINPKDWRKGIRR